MDPEKVGPIEKSETFARLTKEGFVPLHVVDSEARVGRQPNGVCGFRRDDRCSIHSEMGQFAKPVVCQLYPFNAVNTPDGYYLSLSFSCPTVLDNSGTGLQEQIPELSRALGESSYFANEAMEGDTQVPLFGQESVNWGRYLELEEQLWVGIKGEDPMKELLKAATSVLGFGEFKMENFGAVATEFPFFTAYSIATLEYPKDAVGRERLCIALQEEEQPHSQLLGRKLPVFMPQAPEHERTKKLFFRYMENQIKGKQLISEGTLFSRLLMLAVCCTAALYYLNARTQGKQPSKEDLAWVFNLVETAISGHSEIFHDLFRQYEHSVLESLKS